MLCRERKRSSLRKLNRLARSRGVDVRFEERRGKGSHGTKVFLWQSEDHLERSRKGTAVMAWTQGCCAGSFRPDGKAFRLQEARHRGNQRLCQLRPEKATRADQFETAERTEFVATAIQASWNSPKERLPTSIDSSLGPPKAPETSLRRSNSEFVSLMTFDELDIIRNQPDIDETTREQLIRARLGQGPFRDAVFSAGKEAALYRLHRTRRIRRRT